MVKVLDDIITTMENKQVCVAASIDLLGEDRKYDVRTTYHLIKVCLKVPP